MARVGPAQMFGSHDELTCCLDLLEVPVLSSLAKVPGGRFWKILVVRVNDTFMVRTMPY